MKHVTSLTGGTVLIGSHKFHANRSTAFESVPEIVERHIGHLVSVHDDDPHAMRASGTLVMTKNGQRVGGPAPDPDADAKAAQAKADAEAKAAQAQADREAKAAAKKADKDAKAAAKKAEKDAKAGGTAPAADGAGSAGEALGETASSGADGAAAGETGAVSTEADAGQQAGNGTSSDTSPAGGAPEDVDPFGDSDNLNL